MTTHVLINENIVGNCMRAVAEAGDQEKLHEVIIREVKAGKTLKQLKGHFGVWIEYLCNVYGESQDEMHIYLKRKFLARIYFAEPWGIEQENWVDLCALYQESGQQDKLKAISEKISLSWASLGQMKKFMNSVEQHFISINQPLPVIDKYYKRNWRK